MKASPPLRRVDSVEALGRVKASLAALAAGAALTRTCALHTEGIYRSGGESRRREHTMFERSLTPNITVTIGHHTRIYFAFVTTAPAELDSPATVTLHGALFAEMAGFAADPITLDETHGRMSARLILVDAMELAWQRAKYRGNQHQLLSADPGLVGLNTLQHWLWQRLQAPASSQVAA
jgi:hypothetical protein